MERPSFVFRFLVAGALCLLPALAIGRLFSPNLFIAGDGFSLEQAVSDAAKQKRNGDPSGYNILVLGPEIQRIEAATGATSVRDLIRQVESSGASIFVCTKDLKAFGLQPADLFPGIHAIRGNYSPEAAASLARWEKNIPEAPDLKMKAICSSWRSKRPAITVQQSER